jgi:hypothetical protein
MTIPTISPVDNPEDEFEICPPVDDELEELLPLGLVGAEMPDAI